MPILERDTQLQQLAATLERAMAGDGVCVQVHGEAGAGKSTLLRHFFSLLAAETPRAWASCEPLLPPRPLSPFVDLADQWPPSLAQALREGRIYSGLLADLRAALVRRSGVQLLVIEDVHWADVATLDALRYLGRRLAGSRLILVLSFRDDDSVGCQPLRQVMGDLPAADVLRIAVPSLSADAVAVLARQAGRSSVGLLEATGGNAFFVTESLSSPGDTPAASVCDAVAARLARLTPAARAAAELLAVSPAPLECALVEPLLASGAAALDECCEKGMLRSCGARFAFRHELARQAVLHGIAPGRLVRLHRQLFEAARQHGGVALQRLVHHAAHGGLDAEVLALAPQAARAAAAMSAHHEAAALYRRALAHRAVLAPSEQAGLLEAAAAEYRLIGAVAESMAASEQALVLRREQVDAVRIGMNLRLLAMGHWYDLGQRAPAQAAIEESIVTLRGADAAGDGARAELALACAEHSRMLCGWSLHGPSIQAGDEAVRIADALPTTPAAQRTLVLSLRAAASARLFVRDDAEAYTALERALDLALHVGAEDSVAQLYALQQMVSLIYRRHDRALAVADKGLAWCAARDLDAQRARLLDNCALSLIELGRWGEADAALAQCLALPACVGRLRQSVHHLQARLQVRRGDMSCAGYWQALSAAPAATPLGYRLSAVLAACVEAAWLQGQHEPARELAAQSAQAALEGHDARLLGPALVWLARLGVPLPVHRLDIAPEHALELAGEHAQAVAVWRERGCVYEAALAAMHGDAASARWSLETLQSLGADGAAQAAGACLRERGVRGLPRGPQARTRHDPEGLTPRQRQIHALLAQGLSNAGIAARLHRSERTVENHVAQVLAKLGVPSRAMLAQRQAGI